MSLCISGGFEQDFSMDDQKCVCTGKTVQLVHSYVRGCVVEVKFFGLQTNWRPEGERPPGINTRHPKKGTTEGQMESHPHALKVEAIYFNRKQLQASLEQWDSQPPTFILEAGQCPGSHASVGRPVPTGPGSQFLRELERQKRQHDRDRTPRGSNGSPGPSPGIGKKARFSQRGKDLPVEEILHTCTSPPPRSFSSLLASPSITYHITIYVIL